MTSHFEGQERAFDGHLDMIKASVARADGVSFQIVKDNLHKGLENAFEMVVRTDMAVASADDVLSAFNLLAMEVAKTPMGIGRSDGVEEARQLLLQRIEILRADLHKCSPSATAKALLLE